MVEHFIRLKMHKIILSFGVYKSIIDKPPEAISLFLMFPNEEFRTSGRPFMVVLKDIKRVMLR